MHFSRTGTIPGRQRPFRLAPMLLTLLVAVGCRVRTGELDEVQTMAYSVKPAVVRVNAYAVASLTLPATDGQRSVTVSTGAGGSGTGFVIHPDGWLVTSAHVVETTIDEAKIREQLLRNGAAAILQERYESDVLGALVRSGEIADLVDEITARATLENVQVVNRVDLSNGVSLPFDLARMSPSMSNGGRDLALLKIDATDLPTLRVAASLPRVQERIWIAGYPSVASSRDADVGGWLSAETDLEPTITSGSVTAIRKSVTSDPIVQTDAPVYPGHSGGPAVNLGGIVVGIPTWGHASADQIRFLVSSTTVREFLEEGQIELDVAGPFNAAYQSALRAAGSGDWKSAALELRKADAIFPGSPDVTNFLNEAERAHRTSPRWTDRVAIAAAGVSGAILLLALLRLRWRSPASPEMPQIREEITITPFRGDRNGEEAVSFRENGTNGLGSFTVLNGREAGRRMGLGGSGIRIGRESRYCEIVFTDPKISRLHAEIVSFEGRIMLIDRNSSNGTFVNDERIERTFLRDGDIIYFGGRHAVAVAFRS